MFPCQKEGALRQISETAGDAFEHGLQSLADAGGGVYSVLFVDCDEGQRLLGAYRHGDPAAGAYVEVVRSFLIELERAPGEKRGLCLTCDRVFGGKKRPLVISVIVPSCEQPTNALVSGVCRSCGAGRAGWPAPGWRRRLAELVTPRLRELWGPEARFAEPIHVGPAGMG